MAKTAKWEGFVTQTGEGYRMSGDSQKQPDPGNAEDFLSTASLYKPVNLGWIEMLRLRCERLTLDLYCPSCALSATFNLPERLPQGITSFGQLVNSKKIGKTQVPLEQFAYNDGWLGLDFKCARDHHHHLLFVCQWVDGAVQKVGQYPSIADLYTGDFKKFSKLLPPEKLRELNKATGLYSHGIGAGSFVYLRRVFEYMIGEARKRAEASGDWNDPDFDGNRMEDKINSLKDFLPKKLVNSRAIYSIMGKGIHELSDDECNNYFLAVQAAIDLILTEELEKREHAEKEAKVDSAIAQIKSELGQRVTS
jgi:hypothetical protein